MTALNFPDSPAAGDIYDAPNGVQYQYDGISWNVVSAAAGVPGPQGEPGPIGPQGEPGPVGFKYVGRVGTESDLAGVVGISDIYDVYIANDTGIGHQLLANSNAPEGKSFYPMGRLVGENGADGEDGVSPRYMGRINNYTELEALTPGAKGGQFYITNDTGEGYFALAIDDPNVVTAWEFMGRLVGQDGAVGPQGETGATGPQGEAGIQGVQGEPGPAGAQGEAGPAGVDGVEGPEGPQGVPGLGLRFIARVPTIDDLPATANQGDVYLIEASGDAWVWDETVPAFVNAGPVVGPTGAQGPTGPQGEAGPAGPAGAEGPQGVAGPTAVSADAGNTSKLGTDGKIFTPSQASYFLPTASASVLGGVKVGAGLAIDANGVMTASTSGTFVQKAGDTMTGPLLITVATGFALKVGTSTDFYGQYKASSGQYRIEKGGVPLFEFGPTTNESLKPLLLPADPTLDLQAATKKYVDSKSSGGGTSGLPTTGGTMTGTITLPTTVQSFLWGASTYNMFGANGGVAIRYGNANIVTFTATGSTFIQKITTPGTGQGVEFGSGGAYMSKVGTGIGVYCGGQQRWTFDSTKHKSLVPIELPADPVNALEAAPKQYVDTKPTIVSMPAGGTAPDAASYPNNTLLVEYV
jgi:hypothetical protein